MPLSKRLFLQFAAAIPALALTFRARAGIDAGQRKAGYAARLKRLLADGGLPYIDIESSCNSRKLDIDLTARQLDELGIGLMALSADPTQEQWERGTRYDDLSERLQASYPDRFIPVGNGGLPPFDREGIDDFLAAQAAAAGRQPMLLLGEYEIRHYPSPRQVKRGEWYRDVDIAIDGPVGHKLFALAERLDLPFQLHYEIEDRLLPPLEAMLERYPRAKVIWCHLAQIRYAERSTRYSPEYIDGLILRFPNLYFDTAFGNASSTYPVSGQRHAHVWNDAGGLRPEWLELLVAHAPRFLSALDLGGDRMQQIVDYDRKHRQFLACLPPPTRHQIAYRSAWSLLFGEEFA